MFRRLLAFESTRTMDFCSDGEQRCTPGCISESLREHHDTLVRESRGVI